MSLKSISARFDKNRAKLDNFFCSTIFCQKTRSITSRDQIRPTRSFWATWCLPGGGVPSWIPVCQFNKLTSLKNVNKAIRVSRRYKKSKRFAMIKGTCGQITKRDSAILYLFETRTPLIIINGTILSEFLGCVQSI